MLGARLRKPPFQNNEFFFYATAESGKPLLKEPQHATSKQNSFRKINVAKLSFLVSNIPFQALSGFYVDIVTHVGTPICCNRPLVGTWWLSSTDPKITAWPISSSFLFTNS